VPQKRTAYQERMTMLLREAKLGSSKAMGELYERYHVNRLMIKGELVDLKNRLTQSLSKS
jgi:hypothetical protein